MSLVYTDPIIGPIAWEGSSLSDDLSWEYSLSEAEVDELKTAVYEAFDLVDSIMQQDNMRVDMMMQLGDFQLVNNYTVLHSQTSLSITTI